MNQNSVAIGFVFELDEFLYMSLTSRRTRVAFEEAPPRVSSPLSSNRGKTLCSNWAWVLFFVDIGFSMNYYFFSIYDSLLTRGEDLEPAVLRMIRDYALTRTMVLIIAHIHITRISGASDTPLGMYLLRALSFAVVMLGVMAFLFTVVYGYVLWAWLAKNVDPIFAHDASSLCLRGEDEGLDCMMLHRLDDGTLNTELFEQLSQTAAVVRDGQSRFAYSLRVWA